MTIRPGLVVRSTADDVFIVLEEVFSGDARMPRWGIGEGDHGWMLLWLCGPDDMPSKVGEVLFESDRWLRSHTQELSLFLES